MISAREKSEQDTGAREAYVWFEGEAQGKAQGKAEGKAEGKADVIQAMVARGRTIEEIVDFTGISEEEIKMVIK